MGGSLPARLTPALCVSKGVRGPHAFSFAATCGSKRLYSSLMRVLTSIQSLEQTCCHAIVCHVTLWAHVGLHATPEGSLKRQG